MWFGKYDATWGYGKREGDWIQLTAGSYYKINAQHRDTGGAYWMSTGFEFKKAGSTSHPMASKAVQSLRIEHTSDAAETWTITVLNPGTG